MRRHILTALAFAAFAAPLAAQSPCDVPAATVYREPRAQLLNLRLGWCMRPVDTEGVPITEPLGFSLSIDGGPPIDLGLLQPLSGPNANGDYYFEVHNAGALTAGTLTLKAYTASLGMSAASDAITLTLTGSPRKPTNATVLR